MKVVLGGVVDTVNFQAVFTLSYMYVAHARRTCTTYMCDECLHYRTCTSDMNVVHVRRTFMIV